MSSYANGLAVLQTAWHKHSCKDLFRYKYVLMHICTCAGFLLEGWGGTGPLEILS